MTTIIEPDKISPKISLPIVVLLIAGGIGIWFLPIRWGYYYAGNILWNYVFHSLVSFGAILGIIMLLVWTNFKSTRSKEQ